MTLDEMITFDKISHGILSGNWISIDYCCCDVRTDFFGLYLLRFVLILFVHLNHSGGLLGKCDAVCKPHVSTYKYLTFTRQMRCIFNIIRKTACAHRKQRMIPALGRYTRKKDNQRNSTFSCNTNLT